MNECLILLSPRRFVNESVITNKSPLRLGRACTWREKRIDVSRRATWTRERCRVYCWGWILAEGKKIRTLFRRCGLSLPTWQVSTREIQDESPPSSNIFPSQLRRVKFIRVEGAARWNFVVEACVRRIPSRLSSLPMTVARLRQNQLRNLANDDAGSYVKEILKLALYILNDCASRIFTGLTIRSISLSPFCSSFFFFFLRYPSRKVER